MTTKDIRQPPSQFVHTGLFFFVGTHLSAILCHSSALFVGPWYRHFTLFTSEYPPPPPCAHWVFTPNQPLSQTSDRYPPPCFSPCFPPVSRYLMTFALICVIGLEVTIARPAGPGSRYGPLFPGPICWNCTGVSSAEFRRRIGRELATSSLISAQLPPSGMIVWAIKTTREEKGSNSFQFKSP